MLTWLLGRVLREQPDWTPQRAYSEVQRRVSRVTHVPWNVVGLEIDRSSPAIPSPKLRSLKATQEPHSGD